MEHNINNIEQFKQCLLDVASPTNNLQAAAERSLRILEIEHPNLYVAYILEALIFQEELPRVTAGICLGNSLRKDIISHSKYDRIFEQYLLASEGPSKSSWRSRTLKALPVVLARLVVNQLKENVDMIFNKYLTLFDSDTRTGRVTPAIIAAELLFEERSSLVKEHVENSSRLQLVFDKLVHLLKSNDAKFSRYVYPTVVTALKSAEYLSNESVLSSVLQRAVELIDISPAMSYQVLVSCLSQVYEHLEPFMERLICGIGKIDESRNAIEENKYPDRVETVFNFWSEFCRFEQKIREDNEELLYLEISPPVTCLELLQRYGDRVIEELLLLVGSMDSKYHTPNEDGSWCDQHMRCISEISNTFNIDISPYLDKVPAGRTKLLLSAESYWTQTFAKIQEDSLDNGVYPINLRVSPSFLSNALDSKWPNIEDQRRKIKIRESFVQGAVEYLPMYDRSVQDNCITVACACIMSTQDKQLGVLAELLPLKTTDKVFKVIFQVILICLNSRNVDAHSDADVKCLKTFVQLYSLPDISLQSFVERIVYSVGRRSCKLLYHLIKPLQKAPETSETIFSEIIDAEFFEFEDGKYYDALLLLGVLCQKLGATIPSEMYSEIWTTLQMISSHSYNIFDTMACITPPAGVSYLSHLETVIDLFKKKLLVTDDVNVEHAIRALTAVLHIFKKSSNEFLFVGQITRIVDLLQPAIENEPSIETMRAYLTFIRSLSTIDQASSALRTESVMSVLKHASEQSDGTTRHLALNVKKALEK